MTDFYDLLRDKLMSLFMLSIWSSLSIASIMRLEIFTVMKIQVVVFWVMIPSSDVGILPHHYAVS